VVERAGNGDRGEPQPARANGEASAAKPRSLALDVFGDYVRYHGGELPLRALVSLLECFDVAEATTRMMMSRLRERGVFSTRRQGRQTVYRLTPSGLAVLEEGRSRIFDRRQSSWTGSWSLVIYSVPETDRAARERVRRSLQWLGFGQLAAGTWISPHERLDDVERALRDEGTTRLDVLHASSRSLEDDRAFAARCWDLDGLRLAYLDLSARIDARLAAYAGSELDDRETFIERMWLVHEYRKFPYRDPDLPRELLPVDWPGAHAHAAFLRAHELLRNGAERYYLRVASGKSPTDASLV
jgi:phenylacetic acid degradation operon negative regulatory protein